MSTNEMTTDRQCDKPTVEWHGWTCGQGYKHEGPCKPSKAEADRIADNAAVDAFAQAMKDKLATARANGRSGWQNDEPGMQQRLSDMLCEHVRKGDPRDVANFCMFLHQRGESILARGPMFPERMEDHLSAQAKVWVTDEDVERACDAYEAEYNKGDLDFRENILAPYLDCTRAALESFAARLSQGAQGAQGEAVACVETHPTNRTIFKHMCAHVGIELGVDTIDTAYAKFRKAISPAERAAVPDASEDRVSER